MTTLRDAIKRGKIKGFVQEHETDEPGDLEKLDAALRRPASQRSKEAPKASFRDASCD